MESIDLAALLKSGHLTEVLLAIVAWFMRNSVKVLTKLHGVYVEKLAEEKVKVAFEQKNMELLEKSIAEQQRSNQLLETMCGKLDDLPSKVAYTIYPTPDLSQKTSKRA